MNAGAAVIQGDRVDDGEVDRAGRWRDHDAIAGDAIAADEILDYAVAHGEACAGVEDNAVIGSSGAVNFQTGQDDIARNRIDGDAVALRRAGDRRPAIAVDGDRISVVSGPYLPGLRAAIIPCGSVKLKA